jgi:hypothetical protein
VAYSVYLRCSPPSQCVRDDGVVSDDTTENSRHVSVWIDRPPGEVYAFAADPQHLPRWAAGLASGLGDITVDFVPTNDLGVLDHVVTLPSGEAVYNPMRVMPAATQGEARCEVVFTVRRRGQTTEDFDADAAAVAADLKKLRSLLQP